MRIVGLTWTVFRLPLRVPFRTATSAFVHRDGILLRLATDAGIVGLGEASPHPALGPQGVREALRALERVEERALGAEAEELPDIGADIPPALACALDVAACDALAQAQGISVARLLSADAHEIVPVNATIGAATAAGAAAEAAAARDAGFQCVKLKVGMAATPATEAERVAAVRRALGPHIKLRLDANGAWSREQAVSTIRALASFDLELVEQPVPANDVEGLACVRAAVRVLIAADEAVTNAEAARRLLEAGAADILVLKPMVVGGLRPACRIRELAAAAGAECIVTTTIDSGVGTAAALHLAATLPEPARACGLATRSLLAGDIVRDPPAAHSGQMLLPDRPGLGVELDEKLLSQFAISEGQVMA